MLSRFVRIKGVKKLIFPLDKSFDKLSPEQDNRQMNLYRLIAEGAIITGYRDAYQFSKVYCREHDRHELLPSFNYWHDLVNWYKIGLHPRFSVIGALLKAEQRYTEIQRFANFDNRGSLAITRNCLKSTKTKTQFLSKMRPHLFTSIRVRGRVLRVTNAFAERIEKKAFAVDDFFRTQNQELRRIILRVVPMDKVLSRMKKVAEDKEGALYDLGREDWNRRRYLHVKCPSTGQRYLLEVPRDQTSPKNARRWTFDLPENCSFAKEA